MSVESRSGDNSNVAGAGHPSSNDPSTEDPLCSGNSIAYLRAMKPLLLLYATIIALLSMSLKGGSAWRNYEVYFGSVGNMYYVDDDLPSGMKVELFGYISASLTGYTWTSIEKANSDVIPSPYIPSINMANATNAGLMVNATNIAAPGVPSEVPYGYVRDSTHCVGVDVEEDDRGASSSDDDFDALTLDLCRGSRLCEDDGIIAKGCIIAALSLMILLTLLQTRPPCCCFGFSFYSHVLIGCIGLCIKNIFWFKKCSDRLFGDSEDTLQLMVPMPPGITFPTTLHIDDLSSSNGSMVMELVLAPVLLFVALGCNTWYGMKLICPESQSTVPPIVELVEAKPTPSPLKQQNEISTVDMKKEIERMQREMKMAEGLFFGTHAGAARAQAQAEKGAAQSLIEELD